MSGIYLIETEKKQVNVSSSNTARLFSRYIRRFILIYWWCSCTIRTKRL